MTEKRLSPTVPGQLPYRIPACVVATPLCRRHARRLQLRLLRRQSAVATTSLSPVLSSLLRLHFSSRQIPNGNRGAPALQSYDGQGVGAHRPSHVGSRRTQRAVPTPPHIPTMQKRRPAQAASLASSGCSTAGKSGSFLLVARAGCSRNRDRVDPLPRRRYRFVRPKSPPQLDRLPVHVRSQIGHTVNVAS